MNMQYIYAGATSTQIHCMLTSAEVKVAESEEDSGLFPKINS